jgi:hypothetical protein
MLFPLRHLDFTQSSELLSWMPDPNLVCYIMARILSVCDEALYKAATMAAPPYHTTTASIYVRSNL